MLLNKEVKIASQTHTITFFCTQSTNDCQINVIFAATPKLSSFMFKHASFLILLLSLLLAPQLSSAQVISTTLNETDRTSLTYTVVLRDTANIWANLYNDILDYKSKINSAWTNLVIKKSTDLSPELDKAFMDDVFRYTDAHSAEDVENTARANAENLYNKGLE